MMHKARLNRLFAADGRCVNVAVDHGFFGEYSFFLGIENMPKVIPELAESKPDAIQLSLGMAALLQSIPGKEKPSLVLRADTANIYGNEVPQYPFNKVIARAVEQALIVDAASICVNLFQLSGHPEVHAQCVDNINKLKPECERYGMPLMVEPLVFQPNAMGGGYMIDGDIQKIMTNVRQAVELGADIIKADPCHDIREYHKVIEVACGCPVLVRGGSKAPEEEILQRTQELMSEGVAGIVYGRNVIQHRNPAKMLKSLMALVHYGETVEQALRMLE